MKPRIYLYNGRWFVYSTTNDCFGFITRKAAYSYAKAIWKRNGK